MPSLRPLVVLALTVLGAVLSATLLAPAAAAEEAIVLDNGAVLRGTSVREDASVVVFRLSGVGTDNRIEIRRDRILKRFTTDASGLYDPKDYPGGAPSGPGGKSPKAAPVARTAVVPAVALPEEEPQAHEEGFVRRLARLAAIAFPQDPGARTLLIVLAFLVLLCLVGLGSRMADIEGVTLARTTILAVALAGLVAADAMWPGTFLRADRATWVVPVELAAWVGVAAVTVRCGIGRAVQLLAFVVFSGALVTFASGAVLVAA